MEPKPRQIAEDSETLEFLIRATVRGARYAFRSQLAAGVPASTIRRDLQARFRAEFSQDDEPLLNASLIAAVHLALDEMLN